MAKAAVKIGGAEVLASRLEITTRVLKMYLEGDQEIPDSVLLRAIDIIIEDLPQALPDPSTQLARKAEALRRSTVRSLVAPV